MSKVYVCARFTLYDRHLFEHFMKYYLNLGVYKFLINFNYKFETDEDNFLSFMEYIKNSKYIDNIIYNIGPNIEKLSETPNIIMLRNLVNENVNLTEDYIIPADSDEFQEFPDSLKNTIDLMKTEGYSYLHGCTKERISENGEIIDIKPDINIFDQFPKHNYTLFCQPKIGIIKAKFFTHLGVGHHYISISDSMNEQDRLELDKNKRSSYANHFRWNLQSKRRIENWCKLWNNEKFTGWKDVAKYEKMLNVFNQNLLEYNPEK